MNPWPIACCYPCELGGGAAEEWWLENRFVSSQWSWWPACEYYRKCCAHHSQTNGLGRRNSGEFSFFSMWNMPFLYCDIGHWGMEVLWKSGLVIAICFLQNCHVWVPFSGRTLKSGNQWAHLISSSFQEERIFIVSILFLRYEAMSLGK